MDIPDAVEAASVAVEEDNVPDFVLAGDEAAGAALAFVLDVRGTADAESGAALLDAAASMVEAVAAVASGGEGIDEGAFDGTVALHHHIVAREGVEDGDREVAILVVAGAAVAVVVAAALGSGFVGEGRRAGAAEPEDGKGAVVAATAAVGRPHDEVDIDAAAAAAAEGIADKGCG